MASGDIGNPSDAFGGVIDSLTFESNKNVLGLNSVVKVAKNIYAVAYPQGRFSGQAVWVVTFQVNDDGTIGDTVIDKLQIENASYCDEATIIHITGNMYAAAYRSNRTSPFGSGWIKTFTIDSAGNIGASTVDELQFETGYANTPSIVHIDGIYYAIAYTGLNGCGEVKTIAINGLGTILAVDSFEFWNSGGPISPHIISIGNNYYAIAFVGAGELDFSFDGFISTITIDTSGFITKSVIDTYEISTLDTGRSPRLVQVYNDIYAVALFCAESTNIKTFTISNTDGSIGTVIDSMVFDEIGMDRGGAYPDIIKLQDSFIYVVPYMGCNQLGRVRTFTIDNAGNISPTTIDMLIFSESDDRCYIPRIIQVTDAGVCLVVYGHGSANNYGTAFTFQVENPFMTNILSDAYIRGPIKTTTTITSSAFIILRVVTFKAIPYEPGVLLSWSAGCGDINSTSLDKCKVTIQYSTDGLSYAILNTPPYVTRDLVQYQGTPNVVYQDNLVDGTRYYYSLFIFYEDTQLWAGPFYSTPSSVVPTTQLISPFASGSLSFSKLETNTRINPLHEVVSDVIVWLPSNRSGSAKAIEDTLSLIKPAHTKLNIYFEHYYVAHTTTTQFNSCTFASGSYTVSKGTIKNRVGTIDSSFNGRPKILGG